MKPICKVKSISNIAAKSAIFAEKAKAISIIPPCICERFFLLHRMFQVGLRFLMHKHALKMREMAPLLMFHFSLRKKARRARFPFRSSLQHEAILRSLHAALRNYPYGKPITGACLDSPNPRKAA